MAYTTISKSSDNFKVKLYTGNGSSQSITGVGFQPDWVWLKSRVAGDRHNVYDVVRSTQKPLFTHLADVEGTTNQYGTLTSFDSDGFSLLNGSTSSARTNTNGNNYVSWNWKAGGSAVANYDGSITSYVSVNASAGFSIVKWSASASATIGHGLGVKPAMVITKSRDNATNWATWHKGLTGTEEDVGVTLNTNSASASFYTDYWGTGGFTSSVFGVLNSGFHNNAGEMISYCFRDVTGFSKFGHYIGNGSTDGSFIYTGFRPAFVMTKKVSGTGDWLIRDSKRDFNGQWRDLYANATNQETSPDANTESDLVSNGFKTRMSHTNHNGSGGRYIYMAFAEAPLVGSNNVPCTAR